MKVIRCLGSPNDGPSPEGLFLKTYNPEAFDGLGDSSWTADCRKAMKFEDGVAAIKCYLQVPSNRPIREDGKPNRPLTALSIVIEDEEE